MITRGPLSLLIYSGEIGYKKNILFGTIGARRPVSCISRLDLVGWVTSDGATHVLSCGYRGSYPHS
jgi:hypothetical protein